MCPHTTNKKKNRAMLMVSFILTLAQPCEATDGTAKPYRSSVPFNT